MLKSSSAIGLPALLALFLSMALAVREGNDVRPTVRRAPGAGGPRRVLLIGIDGSSFDLVRRWVREEKLPNTAALLADGASGYLSTIAAPRLPGRAPTISSPVVWTTIATGKLPDKHGVWDFGQPLPDDLYAWMTATAEIELPFAVRSELRLRLTMRVRGESPAEVAFSLNGHALPTAAVAPKTADVQLAVDEGFVRAGRNVLRIDVKGAPRGPADAVGCRSLLVETLDGTFICVADPWRTPQAFSKEWTLPPAEARILIQPTHRRVRAIWDILGERLRTVALVGWWGTWPAYPVNGVMLSSHLGLRGKKGLVTHSTTDVLEKTENLTYPESYIQHILDEGLYPEDADAEMKRRVIDLSGCRALDEKTKQQQTVIDVFAQDLFYEKLACDLLRSGTPVDLVTVFFEGTDVFGHKFYGFMEGHRARKDAWIECPDDGRLQRALENYYVHIDSLVGELVDSARRSCDTVMIVTDHGMSQFGHADNGWISMSGPGIRRTVLRQATVRDVMPTLLYLYGLPVPKDVDGRPLLEAFTPEYLAAHPPQMIDTYETTPMTYGAAVAEMDEEMEERFRALGYIQ